MAARGKRKYACGECGTQQFVHWVELSRRTRPRCTRCGSARLEPHSDGAKDDQAVGALNLSEHVPTRGDLVRATGRNGRPATGQPPPR